MSCITKPVLPGGMTFVHPAKDQDESVITNLKSLLIYLQLMNIAARGVQQNLLRSLYLRRTARLNSSFITPQIRPHLYRITNMSNDEDYAAFLDKANQDTGSASTQSKSSKADIKAVNTDIPASLKEVDEVLVSDSDEPFEPVSLKYKDESLPKADALGKLIGVEKLASIEEKDFDPRKQYASVIDLVRKAGNGQAGFFKAQLDRTRIQYLVVSIDTKHERLVGLKALAVES